MFSANSADPGPCPAGENSPAILVVGLGNPILGDDGIGWRVAQAVQAALESKPVEIPGLEIACCALGGLSLMEQLIGWDKAIIIDAVQTTAGIPGEVYDFCLEDLPDGAAGHMTAAHDTSLLTALEVGRAMGAVLPSEISLIGIEARAVYDFTEELSPAVESSIPEAVRLVLEKIEAVQSMAPIYPP
jgi:hydrogenase maturation protease